jgi:2,4-dichlorophenol 6-monooxygenase
MTEIEEVPVVIVGGGPVGLTASLLLSRLGVRHVLLESRPKTSPYPRAIGLSQRTMETFRMLGLEDTIATHAAPRHAYERTAWYTSLGGPTDLHSRQLATRYGWGGGPYAAEYAAASPSFYRMMAQVRLDPLLRTLAEEQAPGAVRFDFEVVGLAEDDSGVTVKYRGPDGESELRASYVLGADGGRTVANELGISYTGPTQLVNMVNVHFKANLADVTDREVMMSFFVNPDFGGSAGTGFIYHLGPWTEAGESEEWIFLFATLPDDPARFDEDAALTRLRRTLGVELLDLEVLTISHWQVQSVVADNYASGRTFLVGDAAHRVPPSGGLGLNTGIADVRNLCWKVALALAVPGSEPVLVSYEAERRPVAQTVAAISLAGFLDVVGLVDGALGIDPDQAPEIGWNNIRELSEPGGEGDKRRAALGEALESLDSKFHSYGAEVGYFYTTGAIQPASDAGDFDPQVYRASAAPGHHLPHFWLDSARDSSTVDLVQPEKFVCIVDAAETYWRATVAALPEQLRALIVVARVSGDSASPDHEVSWAVAREVGPDGAILVRPDGIVAWRWDDAADDSGNAIAAALTQLLGIG